MGEKELPVDIVGSSNFGIDPKIMSSRTFNMIVSDNFLVDYGGYENVLNISPSEGRGIFTSTKTNLQYICVDNNIFQINQVGVNKKSEKLFSYRFIAQIDSFDGDVFFDENEARQIAICDKSYLYIYNYSTGDFLKADLPQGFVPAYVTYQNGYFIVPSGVDNRFALSYPNNGLNWFWGGDGSQGIPVNAGLSTKSDTCICAIRFPGRGNLLLVMGRKVCELWTDVGSSLFPYKLSTSINIDYGCLNQSTVASLDNMVVWLGINEKSGPAIMYTTGADIKQLSTDGINYKLSQLNFPEKSSGFFMKLAGHLVYQLTFYDPSDNYSLIYDFTTNAFFDVTDENMNFHIARRVAFFENDYYFVSFRDGNLYRLANDLFTYNYGTHECDIPRVRVCKNVRLPDSDQFSISTLNITLEQGNDKINNSNYPSYNPRIVLMCSRNGGISYGPGREYILNKLGKRINLVRWWNLGRQNDFCAQFRFYCRGPFRITNGYLNIYQ